jgi:hypothetical protein
LILTGILVLASTNSHVLPTTTPGTGAIALKPLGRLFGLHFALLAYLLKRAKGH